MEQHWIVKEQNRDLIIFALGWASDFHAIEHIRPEGYDILCTDDYRTISPVSPDTVAGYRRIYLFAWSFGVWASELIFRGIPFYKAVALNGTPLPVNNRYGIPSKAFSVTLKGIARTGIEAFNRRTFGDYYDRIAPWLETRPFEDKYDELCNLFECSSKAYSPTIRWDEAVIGMQDVIFPPQNMQSYWEDVSPSTEVDICPDMPHYPFADPALVINRLNPGDAPARRHE